MRAGIVERDNGLSDSEEDTSLPPCVADDPAPARRSRDGKLSQRVPRTRSRPRGYYYPARAALPTEADVEELLTPEDAVESVEACFGRPRETSESRPRFRLGLQGGPPPSWLPPTSARYSRAEDVHGLRRGHPSSSLSSQLTGRCSRSSRPTGSGNARTGAASAVAASTSPGPAPRPSGSSGRAGRRRARWSASEPPARDRASCRLLPEAVPLEDFCRLFDASRASTTGRSRAGRRRDDHDVARPGGARRVAKPGALVRRRREPIEARARQRRSRTGDVRLLRLGAGEVEAGDLAEPVERGVLDWLEVHELGGRGRRDLRTSEADDMVVFKSLRIAAEDLAVEGSCSSGARTGLGDRALAELLGEEVHEHAVVPRPVGAELVAVEDAYPLEADAGVAESPARCPPPGRS